MSGGDTGGDAAAGARALASARWIVGTLVAGALLLTALGSRARGDAALRGLVLPAVIAGAASPVVHVLLAGALWPTQERLAAFLECASGAREQ